MDDVGPDTGAENVARFIQRRDTPGSYHDLVDSDSAIYLVRYPCEAYQDGTGSNPWALSISFALAAADWPRLSPAKRYDFLEQAVSAFRRQQAWLVSNGYPTTPLRRITKAQSDAGMAGFISHGDRDPGRRSDPGRDFPWGQFLEMCATITNPEDDMPSADEVAAKVWEHALGERGGIGPANAADWLRHAAIHATSAAARAGDLPAVVRAAIAEMDDVEMTDEQVDRLAAGVVVKLGERSGQ